MKFLALLELAADVELSALAPHLIAEELAVWSAYRRGVLREMHFQKKPVAVSLIFEAENEAAVRSELLAFPLVENNLLTVRIISMGPWLPLEKLFDQNLTKEAFND